MSIENIRFGNKQKQQRGNRIKGLPHSQERDPVTGKYKVTEPDNGIKYVDKNYTGNQGIEGFDNSGILGKDATKIDREREIEGYIKGQIFNNLKQDEKESIKRIKYLYYVTVNNKRIYYVGGFQKKPVLIGELSNELGNITQVYLTNLGGRKFALDINGTKALGRIVYNKGIQENCVISLSNFISQHRYFWRGNGFWTRIINNSNSSDIPNPITNGNTTYIYGRSDYVYDKKEYIGNPYIDTTSVDKVNIGDTKIFERLVKRFILPNLSINWIVSDVTNYSSTNGAVTSYLWLNTDEPIGFGSFSNIDGSIGLYGYDDKTDNVAVPYFNSTTRQGIGVINKNGTIKKIELINASSSGTLDSSLTVPTYITEDANYEKFQTVLLKISSVEDFIEDRLYTFPRKGSNFKSDLISAVRKGDTFGSFQITFYQLSELKNFFDTENQLIEQYYFPDKFDSQNFTIADISFHPDI